MKIFLTTIFGLFVLTGCGKAGEVGDECYDDGDCADGLECHVHEHTDEEHTDEEHSDEEEEAGECEEHDEHSE